MKIVYIVLSAKDDAILAVFENEAQAIAFKGSQLPWSCYLVCWRLNDVAKDAPVE